jgi:hemolysin III
MLVYGTYIPMFFIGIGGKLGWIFLILISLVTIFGVVVTAINVDKSTKVGVICHLANGWAAIIAIPKLLISMGTSGVVFLILGGLMYTIGSVLYGIGHKVRYTHCVFHIFCLLGTFFHFWCIYMYLL